MEEITEELRLQLINLLQLNKNTTVKVSTNRYHFYTSNKEKTVCSYSKDEVIKILFRSILN